MDEKEEVKFAMWDVWSLLSFKITLILNVYFHIGFNALNSSDLNSQFLLIHINFPGCIQLDKPVCIAARGMPPSLATQTCTSEAQVSSMDVLD